MRLLVNADGAAALIYSLPEDDDGSALLDVLRPDAVRDVVRGVAAETERGNSEQV